MLNWSLRKNRKKNEDFVSGIQNSEVLTPINMLMQGSRSPLLSVGLTADSSWYTVNVSTCTWMDGREHRQIHYGR